jgi:hypothetical protein
MAIPERIPIAHEPGFHTQHIGKFGRGRQFMAFVVATLPSPLPSDWEKHKRWYAVLHTFDARGNHLNTEAWYAGVSADGENKVIERAQQKLMELLAGLEQYMLCDIAVKLFSVTIDGALFGLVDSSEPEEGFEERVTLWPNDLLFKSPWDGAYDT